MNISNSSIAFNSIALSAHKNKKKIIKKFLKIIDSGIFLDGKENSLLEKNIRLFLKEGYVTLTASGHDSILLALQSLNLKSKDEVILPVNAYPTVFPVVLSGAKPVFCDVDINGQLNPESLKNKITKNTKAVIFVYLYGLIEEIEKIKKIIEDRNIFLIEDCAQSFGSLYNGKLVGTFGDISCFSFYPTKNLYTFGDGGAIYTRHKNLHEFFRRARSYGEEKKYYSYFVSGHSRLPEIQAGILNCFFKNFKIECKRKKIICQDYKNKLKNLNNFVRPLESSLKSDSVQHLFVIEAKKRDQLKTYLENKKIPTFIHYPVPIHLLPAFQFLNYKKGDFLMAERLSKNILSLPFHPYLLTSQIEYIVKTIKNFYV